MAGLAAALGFPYNSQYLLSGHSCCENAGTTGQLHPSHSPQTPHVCSCQLEQVLQQKMTTLPLGLLPGPGYSGQPNLMFGPTGREPSSVYPPLVRQCDIKDMGSGAMNSPWFINPRFDHHNFDRNSYLTCHRFGDRFSPIDLNSGARRKNATKETTSTLKAWLYEHRKNPYPTKGEKIMLAILTKMTLTQVSTWFANARRRLKKENKMTWSPRNRCGERKDSEGYSDEEDDNEDKIVEEKIDVMIKEPEKKIARKTTVIRSPEDRNPDHDAEPGSEMHSRDTVISERIEPENIWSARSLVETDQTRTQHGGCSLEDSPVKSLRKWVDGCFDRTHTAQSPDTPPQTPPCSETERLTEKVVHSSQQSSISSHSSPTSSPKAENRKNTEGRSTEEHGDGTTNREIDAALALTTLFSRS